MSDTVELLGQMDRIAPLLERARAGSLHHCYLFEGPPQVGKHTAALLLARTAACTAETGPFPCGECLTCKQMAKGIHPDLITLAPDASRKSGTISVAQVRELIRQVRLRPYNASWRTVIIDPVDALMPQAANALLKTLEEPPPDTGFVLVTSRVSSLLPTVLSRSQRVRFAAVSEGELAPFLDQQGVAESQRIARLSMGCPGAALAMGQGGLEALDAARSELVSVLQGGIPAVIDAAEQISKSKDAKGGAVALMGVLETLLRDCVQHACGRPDALIHSDQPELVAAWSGVLWPGGIARLQQQIDQTRQRMLVNVNTRLLLESLLASTLRELGPASQKGLN
ncbi:MAG: DNA polymerase III subunit delta' [Myxococcota bacterium]|nr:DNA polymerase III subunit delta' [Myxococcota bacterium]